MLSITQIFVLFRLQVYMWKELWKDWKQGWLSGEMLQLLCTMRVSVSWVFWTTTFEHKYVHATLIGKLRGIPKCTIVSNAFELNKKFYFCCKVVHLHKKCFLFLFLWMFKPWAQLNFISFSYIFIFTNPFHTFKVCLDWWFRKEEHIHFSFLNYELYNMFFKNKSIVIEVLYDRLLCC